MNNDVIVDESIDYKPASIFDEPPADVPDENKPEQNVQSPPEFLIEQPLAETPIEPDEQIHQHDEGTRNIKNNKFLPGLFNELGSSPPPVMVSNSFKRSDSALNIFDQTTILKLFSAKNWQETFFNRLFRKKFLIISPGDDVLVNHKTVPAIEMLHTKFPEIKNLKNYQCDAECVDEKSTGGLLHTIIKLNVLVLVHAWDAEA